MGIRKYPGEKRNEEVVKMADEQLHIIPTIKKRRITYFGHMIRRNNIHRLVLDGPLDEKITSGGPIMECMTNITEWMRYEDLARLAQDREQWRILQPTFAKKTAHEDVDCLIVQK